MCQRTPDADWRCATSKYLKDWSREAGFDLAGIAPAVVGLGGDRLREWLNSGKHGEMAYMARDVEARLAPHRVLQGAKSVLVVALGYRTAEPIAPNAGEGRISRYAWGEDYHDVVRRKLRVVSRRMRDYAPNVRTRIVVDSAPVMERDYARLAGLGWFGKNTLLLNARLGSWFFLGAMLLDVELERDAPFETDHCGTCRRCLDACPTGAFDGPYQLDPRRCISYLTIEHKTEIPPDQANQLGPWVYGCDECQEVCPWNHHSERFAGRRNAEFDPRPKMNPVALKPLLESTQTEFHERFAGTAIERIGRERLARNARIAIGTSGTTPGNQNC